MNQIVIEISIYQFSKIRHMWVFVYVEVKSPVSKDSREAEFQKTAVYGTPRR